MTCETLAAQLGPICGPAWDSFGIPVLEPAAADLLPLMTRLKGEFSFDVLLDLTAIDYPEQHPRFTVVYHLLNTSLCLRLRLKVRVPEQDPRVATLTGLYGSARFLEREAHEMYGIRFAGNPDLRPILLYEGFVGHPLRKDYPIDCEQPIVTYRR